MVVKALDASVMEPEQNMLIEEKLIKTIELKNSRTLELYDASRKVASDRWLVQLIARIKISIDASLFDKADLSIIDMEDVRNALGAEITFEKKRERNFIDQKKKREVLEDLMNSFINTSIAYLSNNKFPGNFILNEYKKYKEKRSWYNP